MEDGLVHVKNEPEKLKDAGLNPCCDGRWSRTQQEGGNGHYVGEIVLILVVMEDGLVPPRICNVAVGLTQS